MRLQSIFAQCFLAGALLMAQGQPTPDGSIQARNKAVAMRVFDEIFNQGTFHVAGRNLLVGFPEPRTAPIGGPEDRRGGGAL